MVCEVLGIRMIGKAPSRVLVVHTGPEVGHAKVLPVRMQRRKHFLIFLIKALKANGESAG